MQEKMCTTDIVHVGSIAETLARRVIDAALAETQAGKARFAAAVVDHAEALKAFVRQDGAAANATQIAQDKAYTAATSQMSTQAWSQARRHRRVRWPLERRRARRRGRSDRPRLTVLD
jgi:uncharacterized protein GlcG (DUF336 family)